MCSTLHTCVYTVNTNFDPTLVQTAGDPNWKPGKAWERDYKCMCVLRQLWYHNCLSTYVYLIWTRIINSTIECSQNTFNTQSAKKKPYKVRVVISKSICVKERRQTVVLSSDLPIIKYLRDRRGLSLWD